MVIDGAFGPWRPDMPDLNNPGVTTARNVTAAAGANGGVTYKPLKSASLYSDTSMQSRPRGTGVGRDTDGNSRVYGGCAEKLYKIDPLTTQWADVSKSGGYVTSENDHWEFADYGYTMMATNYADYPQYIDKDTNIQFANLTTLLRGRFMAVVREFTVLGSTWDALDGDVPYRLRWSAFDNQFDWNFSQSTMSDFQDIYTGGNIMGVVGGEAGYIFMQGHIVKMTFIGAPLIFQFDVLPSSVGKGCIASESIITIEGKTYYLSNDGFYMLQGDQVSPVGTGLIDNWFLADANIGSYRFMTRAADPREKLIYWSYCSNQAAIGVPDKMIILNYSTGLWTEAASTAPFIFNSISLPWTIEQLDVFGDIANIPAPFDSPVWAGGAHMLWAMDYTGKIYVFGGENLVGTLETQESLISSAMNQNEIARGDRTTIHGVRPHFHGMGDVVVRGGYRSKASDNPTYTPSKPISDETGFAYFRHQSRYHRFRFTLSGPWTMAMGYQIDATLAGSR